MAKIMKMRASGPDVKAFQKFLNKTFKCKLKEDGKFGPKMEEAVKGAQKIRKLKIDGIVGPKTIAALGALGSDNAEGAKEDKNAKGKGKGKDKAEALKGQTKQIKTLQDHFSRTKRACEDFIKQVELWERDLGKYRDDSQLVRFDFQSMQKQQKVRMQMMSTTARGLEDSIKKAVGSILE